MKDKSIVSNFILNLRKEIEKENNSLVKKRDTRTESWHACNAFKSSCNCTGCPFGKHTNWCDWKECRDFYSINLAHNHKVEEALTKAYNDAGNWIEEQFDNIKNFFEDVGLCNAAWVIPILRYQLLFNLIKKAFGNKIAFDRSCIAFGQCSTLKVNIRLKAGRVEFPAADFSFKLSFDPNEALAQTSIFNLKVLDVNGNEVESSSKVNEYSTILHNLVLESDELLVELERKIDEIKGRREEAKIKIENLKKERKKEMNKIKKFKPRYDLYLMRNFARDNINKKYEDMQKIIIQNNNTYKKIDGLISEKDDLQKIYKNYFQDYTVGDRTYKDIPTAMFEEDKQIISDDFSEWEKTLYNDRRKSYFSGYKDEWKGVRVSWGDIGYLTLGETWPKDRAEGSGGYQIPLGYYLNKKLEDYLKLLKKTTTFQKYRGGEIKIPRYLEMQKIELKNGRYRITKQIYVKIASDRLFGDSDKTPRNVYDIDVEKFKFHSYNKDLLLKLKSMVTNLPDVSKLKLKSKKRSTEIVFTFEETNEYGFVEVPQDSPDFEEEFIVSNNATRGFEDIEKEISQERNNIISNEDNKEKIRQYLTLYEKRVAKKSTDHLTRIETIQIYINILHFWLFLLFNDIVNERKKSSSTYLDKWRSVFSDLRTFIAEEITSLKARRDPNSIDIQKEDNNLFTDFDKFIEKEKKLYNKKPEIVDIFEDKVKRDGVAEARSNPFDDFFAEFDNLSDELKSMYKLEGDLNEIEEKVTSIKSGESQKNNLEIAKRQSLLLIDFFNRGKGRFRGNIFKNQITEYFTLNSYTEEQYLSVIEKIKEIDDNILLSELDVQQEDGNESTNLKLQQKLDGFIKTLLNDLESRSLNRDENKIFEILEIRNRLFTITKSIDAIYAEILYPYEKLIDNSIYDEKKNKDNLSSRSTKTFPQLQEEYSQSQTSLKAQTLAKTVIQQDTSPPKFFWDTLNGKSFVNFFNLFGANIDNNYTGFYFGLQSVELFAEDVKSTVEQEFRISTKTLNNVKSLSTAAGFPLGIIYRSVYPTGIDCTIKFYWALPGLKSKSKSGLNLVNEKFNLSGGTEIISTWDANNGVSSYKFYEFNFGEEISLRLNGQTISDLIKKLMDLSDDVSLSSADKKNMDNFFKLICPDVSFTIGFFIRFRPQLTFCGYRANRYKKGDAKKNDPDKGLTFGISITELGIGIKNAKIAAKDNVGKEFAKCAEQFLNSINFKLPCMKIFTNPQFYGKGK